MSKITHVVDEEVEVGVARTALARLVARPLRSLVLVAQQVGAECILVQVDEARHLLHVNRCVKAQEGADGRDEGLLLDLLHEEFKLQAVELGALSGVRFGKHRCGRHNKLGACIREELLIRRVITR